MSALVFVSLHVLAGLFQIFHFFSWYSSGFSLIALFASYASLVMLGLWRCYESMSFLHCERLRNHPPERLHQDPPHLHATRGRRGAPSSLYLPSDDAGDTTQDTSPSASLLSDEGVREMRAIAAAGLGFKDINNVTVHEVRAARAARAALRAKQNPAPPATALQQEIAEGEVLYASGLRKMIKLKSDRVLKHGIDAQVAAAEVAAMKFIAEHTTVPIPGNPEHIVDAGRSYVATDHVEGQVLSKVWEHLRDDEKATILGELKAYVNQLRSLESPGYIGSLNRDQCWDCRMFAFACGPFDSEAQMNDHLVSVLTHVASPFCRKFLRRMMREDHKIVFTHADLHWRNIIVKDGHVAAILDWEMAGWYPEYWEYCKALYNERFETEWCTRVQDFLEPYHYEYAVDRLLRAMSPVW
ncbi:kinase-like protein [Gloeophyllum trabeum ATCC 11539]|uniref:Kinase-like protein n=1 Tax=Gloeophyllum trabeum (strain ATCC 11539 / FP-39264 / Madison 617) TaxID=670483 RepID=S7R9D6_GLOTA|nr:kinase-like protein [Gloeophyllum trabeum ATCC 11539]EPQ50890.1 kinase-like protein [Gloeophyllum trabeum ATCC 11539]